MAHSLKSASASVGAMQLSNLCEKLEVASKLGDLNALQTQLEQFKSALEIAFKTIENALPGKRNDLNPNE